MIIFNNDRDSLKLKTQDIFRNSTCKISCVFYLRVIRRSGGRPAFTRPVGVIELLTGFIHPLISVRAKVVALRLDQVRRQATAAVSVVERQCGGHRRHRDTQRGRLCDHRAPVLLVRGNGLGEEVGHQQTRQIGSFGERAADIPKEAAADDAAPAPHIGDRTVVDVPIVLRARLTHEHKPLRVADDLARVQRALDRVEERRLLAREAAVRLAGGRTGENLGCLCALIRQCREEPCKDRLTDQRDRHPGLQRIDRGPLAGALLSGRIDDLFDQR